MTRARGVRNASLKSAGLSSSETPNITKPSTQFRMNSVCGLKLRRIRSMSVMNPPGRFRWEALRSSALWFLVHLLEVDQPRRPHMLDRIDVDVDHRAFARR